MPGACQNNHPDKALIPVAISHSHFRGFTDEPAAAPRMSCAMFDKVYKRLGDLLLLHKSDSLLMLKSYQKEKVQKYQNNNKKKLNGSFHSAKITHNDQQLPTPCNGVEFPSSPYWDVAIYCCEERIPHHFYLRKEQINSTKQS